MIDSERLQAVLDHPLHRALGITDIAVDDGQARLSIDASGMAINPAGMLHGGVVYLLCDVCAYAGLLSRLTPDQEAVTHDLHVSVMRPVAAGARVEFSSRLVRQGRSLCFIDVDVHVEERLVASARVTKSVIGLTGSAASPTPQ